MAKKDKQPRRWRRQAGEHELASVAVRMERACVLSAAVRSSSLDRVQPDPVTLVPLLGACGKALLSEAGRQANALTGRTREHPQGHALRLANFTPRWAKPTASPGPLLPSIPCKKIGRVTSVGLGYCEKKRYRSPLVSL